MGFFENPVSEKTMDFQGKTRLFAENHSDYPQLLGFCGCQLVKSLSIGSRYVHVQIVV
jgi:hypothetical protein